MNIFFSIIIPTYNRASYLENAINSIIQQEFSNFEIVVFDGGSTDNTKSVIEKIIEQNKNKSIRYYYKENGEWAAARNYGLSKAMGDYIIFFDSDDELYPNHLEEAVNYVATKPGVEVFHLRYDIKNGKKIKTSDGLVFHSPPNKELIKGNFLNCNGMVIRRDIGLENKFNEDRGLSAVEDWELWLRLSIKYSIHYVNTITSSIFNHDYRSVLVVKRKN